jgi:hypothetical protein
VHLKHEQIYHTHPTIRSSAHFRAKYDAINNLDSPDYEICVCVWLLNSRTGVKGRGYRILAKDIRYSTRALRGQTWEDTELMSEWLVHIGKRPSESMCFMCMRLTYIRY